MIKPPLTPLQKERFLEQFEEIIRSSSEKTKKLWNGKIEWEREGPVFNDSIHLHLHGKSAHDYEILIGKLNSRSL